MNNVARFSPEQLEDIFTRPQLAKRFHPVVAEKDFWVCWLLKQLFSISELEGWLTFKGGTSLSKCFGLIQRFSEDIDLAVNYERLGYVGDKNPRQADLSQTKRRILLDEMLADCQQYIAGPLLTILAKRITEILGHNQWSLKVCNEDPNVLEFSYPKSVSGYLQYIHPVVSLELGTHAEPIPSDIYPITPYAAEAFPDLFKEPSWPIRTVVARRTFWEKATILHAEYYRPLEKTMLPRYSRHWADLAVMSQTSVKNEALKDLPLLEAVCLHKDRFYHCGWANYNSAKPDSIHLLPHPERLADLRRDYNSMSVMFFDNPMSFNTILEQLSALEKEINSL